MIYTHGAHREDAHAGEIPHESGYIGFSESFDGEYIHFDVFDGNIDETKRFSLTPDEIVAIAKVGYLIEALDIDRLVEECDEIGENMRRRELMLRELRERYDESQPPWNVDDTMSVNLTDGDTIRYDYETDYDAAHDWMELSAQDITVNLEGGNDTPYEYKVEGWGIQKLDNGDFNVVR